MRAITKIWKRLNRKKTNIGAGLLLAALVLGKLAGIWDWDAEWISKMVETLQWTGGLFTGIGLSHKGIKQVNK